MNFVKRKLIINGVCSFCLTGCWDKVEINELAIGELVGGILTQKHINILPIIKLSIQGRVLAKRVLASKHPFIRIESGLQA